MKDDSEITVSGGTFESLRPPEEAVRSALALDELLARLTAKMRGWDGCERVSVVRITRLEKPDEQGCNWSSSIVLDAAGVPPEVYALAYAAMIANARHSWNLK